MAAIMIDADKCTQCGACVATCPASVFAQDGGVPDIVQEEFCIACGHCVAMCPVDAVTHEEFPDGTVMPVDAAVMPSYKQTMELLRSRRSVRLFTDAVVSREEVDCMLEAARTAPTAHNYQEVRYVVVQDKELLAAITKIVVRYFTGLAKQLRNPVARALFRLALSKSEIEGIANMLPDFDNVAGEYEAGRDPILHNAPCLILAHSQRSVNYPETNAALAIHNAALAAHAMGLGGFMLGYAVGACKRNRKIPDLIGIPKGNEVYAGLAVGHPETTFPKWMQRRPLEVTWK